MSDQDPTPTFTQEQLNEAIQKAIQETNAKRDAQEEGLRRNKEQILQESKQKSSTVEELRKQLADAEQARLDKERELMIKEGDIEAVKSQVTDQIKGEYEKILSDQKQLIEGLQKQAYEDKSSSLLGELADGLNIGKDYRELFLNNLRYKGVKHEDGKLTQIGDESIDVYLNKFKESDLFKGIVVPPRSSGGGALGGGGEGEINLHKQMMEISDPMERLAFARKHQNK